MICLEPATEAPLFARLEKLNLSRNQLQSWVDVAELRRLPALQDLNLKGNPIFASCTDYAAAFNLVLGRVPRLLKLNGEQVTEDLYHEAEKYYVKVAFKESRLKDPDFEAANPRFQQLLQGS